MRFLVVAIALVLAMPSTPAEACACCDGTTARTPLGWSRAGGALLIRVDVMGCEDQHVIEIWPIGAAEPSGCFDLAGDPDKRIACNEVVTGTGRQPKASARVKQFPIAAVPLDATRARFTKTRVPGGQLRIAVEVAVRGGGWKRVWNDTINSLESFVDGAGNRHARPVDVKLYPNPRGDRALMLIENEDTSPGSGHWAALVRWVELPKR